MKIAHVIIACSCVAVIALAIASTVAFAKTQQKAESPPSPKQEDEKSELSTFMRQKLSASNQILEGLVTDDLTKVDYGAAELLKMSEAEHWRASNDMMYMNHSRQFRSSVETMQNKANKKSIDGAALAWIDVTMSCIRCHEWVRDTMLVDVPIDFGRNATQIAASVPEPIGGGK